MAHDVFISYSSQDRTWAAQLAADLMQRGVNCFFDQTSLRDGQGWETQIKAALMASHHIVCLWSKSAKDSVWVGRELALFDVLHPDGGASGGQLLKLKLDDTPSAYSSRQQVHDAAVVTAYAAATPPWPGPAWTALVQRLRRAVKQDPQLLTMPVALLTLTQTDLATIGAGELAKIAAELGLDAAALAQRYGPTRLDWRPFANGPHSIGELLDSVKLEIDQRLNPRSVYFELPDDAFWTDHDAAQTWVKGIRQRMIGAVLIDPVALSLVSVQTRLALFSQVLALENVAIIVLHPQQASDRVTRFRRWIREFAVSVVQPYFDPPLTPDSVNAARCGIGIGLDDASEMRRLLQTSIGQLLRRPPAAVAPASPIVGI